MVILEGLAMSFWLLLVCVVGIANGPVGLVVLYEQNVKDRVIELGLTTPEKIKKSAILTGLALFIPVLIVVPILVYFVNGAKGFWDGFTQMVWIYLIMNLFDRLFIDWYWVGHTKAWEIEGTEDLKPYIPKKAFIRKWLGTIVVFPMLAAIIAYIFHLFGM
jgi:small-conductance mechanosensitive channel